MLFFAHKSVLSQQHCFGGRGRGRESNGNANQFFLKCKQKLGKFGAFMSMIIHIKN